MKIQEAQSRMMAGGLTLLGAADGQPFTMQQQENNQFFADAPVTNSSVPVYLRMTVAAKNGSSLADFQTGHKFVAENPETFIYDADGNLTNDGQWSYTWDAENRLTKMVSATSVGPQQQIDFGYDWMGRRISKTVWNNTAGAGTPALSQQFVYDGWNLIAVLNSSSILQSFMWGLDLSGTAQGAGGVGGLLSMALTNSADAGTYFYGYDGNGNVTELVKADQSVAAQYEYSPFGEVIGATGPLAQINPFCFSSKYQDQETALLNYGYRYCNPSTGKWLSRDPIGENGGPNLYGFNNNDAIANIDPLGNNVVFSIDINSCSLITKINFRIVFSQPFVQNVQNNPGWNLSDYTWTDQQKAYFTQRIKDLVEPYYSNIPLKCKCAKKTDACPNGFTVKMQVSFDNSPDATEIDAIAGVTQVGTFPWGIQLNQQSITAVNYNQEGHWQVPVVHEVGHLLGLKHPGQKLNVPPDQRNQDEDYRPDMDSLMGAGMIMRPDDFNAAFCSKIAGLLNNANQYEAVPK